MSISLLIAYASASWINNFSSSSSQWKKIYPCKIQMVALGWNTYECITLHGSLSVSFHSLLCIAVHLTNDLWNIYCVCIRLLLALQCNVTCISPTKLLFIIHKAYTLYLISPGPVTAMGQKYLQQLNSLNTWKMFTKDIFTQPASWSNTPRKFRIETASGPVTNDRLMYKITYLMFIICCGCVSRICLATQVTETRWRLSRGFSVTASTAIHLASRGHGASGNTCSL